MMKLRASYGEIGDDNVGDRFLYISQWAYGGKTNYGYTDSDKSSIYQWYREVSVGNPNVHWEKVKKGKLRSRLWFLGRLDYWCR